MSGNLLHALYDGRGPLSEAYEFYPSRARNTRELRRTVAQMARALVIAAAPGRPALLKLEKCEEALFLAHACFQIGVVLHPLNAAYTDAEVEHSSGTPNRACWSARPTRRSGCRTSAR